MRRYNERDPVARTASTALERAIAYCVDVCKFDDQIHACVEDKLLPGRGVARVYYEAEMEQPEPESEIIEGLPNPVIDPMDEMQPPLVKEQKFYVEYVNWRDFTHSPSDKWENVRWVGFMHKMTRENLIEEFGDIGSLVPLNYGDTKEERKTKKSKGNELDGLIKLAEVWEIWCKETKHQYFVARGYNGLLQANEDPYELTDFFPCPRPMYGYVSNDSLIPIPEYTVYQDQANEVEQSTRRIDKLVESARVKFIYDQSNKKLADLMKITDSQGIPVDNMPDFNAKGGFGGAVQFMPIDKFIEGATALVAHRNQCLQNIYQIIGLSDIMRGNQDKADETATATRSKQIYGGARLRSKQEDVQRFCRDLYRLLGDLISEHSDPDLLHKMTDTPVFVPVQQVDPMTGQPIMTQSSIIPLLRDEKNRAFKIDVETDVTSEGDMGSERAERAEFTKTFIILMQQGIQAAQQGMPPSVIMNLVRFNLAPFRVGRLMEETLDQLEQFLAHMPPPQQGQDMKAQTNLQIAQLKEQDSQRDFQARAMENQTRQMELKNQRDIKSADILLKQAELVAKGQNVQIPLV